jgi:hypothetical protein
LCGAYVLHSAGASDNDQGSASSGPANPLSALAMLSQSKTLKSYGDAELPITVKGDSTGLSIQVLDATSGTSTAGSSGVSGIGGVVGGTP